MYTDYKLNKYLKMTCCINGVFRPQNTQNKTQIKLYHTLALLTLLCGCENWAIKARYARRITATKMKYMSRTTGFSWTDYKTNTEIAKELNKTPVLDKIQEYRRTV
jgi:hypothetical protein